MNENEPNPPWHVIRHVVERTGPYSLTGHPGPQTNEQRGMALLNFVRTRQQLSPVKLAARNEVSALRYAKYHLAKDYPRLYSEARVGEAHVGADANDFGGPDADHDNYDGRVASAVVGGRKRKKRGGRKLGGTKGKKRVRKKRGRTKRKKRGRKKAKK